MGGGGGGGGGGDQKDDVFAVRKCKLILPHHTTLHLSVQRFDGGMYWSSRLVMWDIAKPLAFE